MGSSRVFVLVYPFETTSADLTGEIQGSIQMSTFRAVTCLSTRSNKEHPGNDKNMPGVCSNIFDHSNGVWQLDRYLINISAWVKIRSWLFTHPCILMDSDWNGRKDQLEGKFMILIFGSYLGGKIKQDNDHSCHSERDDLKEKTLNNWKTYWGIHTPQLHCPAWVQLWVGHEPA